MTSKVLKTNSRIIAEYFKSMQAYLKMFKETDDVHNQKIIQDSKMAKRSQKITGNLEIKRLRN